MLMKISLKPAILLILFVATSYGKLSSHIKVCPRNHPDIEKCIIDTIMDLKPLLVSGALAEEYEMPSIEPFTYNDFVIDHGPSFKTEVKDLKSWNGSNFFIEKFKVNVDKMTFDFIVSMPSLKMTGKYKLKAKLPLIDISGNGDLINLVKNSKMRMKLYGSVYDKDGEKYAKFDKINLRILPGQAKITLTNLFNGDPTLSQIGHQLINENQDIFIGEIVPVLEKQFSEVFMEVANKIIGSATFDEILPGN